MMKLIQTKVITKTTKQKPYPMSSKHLVLLTFLLLYNTNFSVCIGVKAPSASAATSLSMASSLFNSMSMHPEDDNAIIGGDDENGRRPPEECKVKNLKQQQRMTMAKLDAHRCLIRDTVIAVPVPDTIIANFVHPSHVVVPRCTGLCLERPGCECVPKKTRQVKINIVMGVNSSSTLQVCSSIDIEEHRGPCKCKCLIKQCHYNQVFNRDLCQCNCKDSFAVLKRDCLTNGGGRAINFWDDDSCSCKCRPRRCVKGHYQDQTTCECKPIVTTCSAMGTAGGNLGDNDGIPAIGHHSVAQAPKYIGLTCVVLVALAMVLSVYYMLIKRKSQHSSLRMRGSLGNLQISGTPNVNIDEERRFRGCNLAAGLSGLAANMQDGTNSIGSLTGSLGHHHRSPGTAYTITINSQSATNLDEAILPLTEDKTRF